MSELIVSAVDLKSGSGAVYAGEPKEGKPGVTLTISDDDLVDLASGKLDGQKVCTYFISFDETTQLVSNMSVNICTPANLVCVKGKWPLIFH